MDQNQILEDLKALTGHEVGLSPWYTIDQDTVNRHAQDTGDDEWIHTDPERAARDTPFGTPIVQSSLLLAQLTRMARSLKLPLDDIAYRLNYGFDRVRLVQPVPVGSRVRGRFELKSVVPKGHHGLLVHLDTSIWIEGDDIAPAAVIELLAYLRINE